jgi:hypothetical protein
VGDRATLPNLTLHNIYYIPNRFFIPGITLLNNQGETVNWLNLNPGLHGVIDASGMGLFQTPNGIPVGGTAQVTWASADAPAGFAFSVQVEQPGSSSFYWARRASRILLGSECRVQWLAASCAGLRRDEGHAP